MSEGVADCKYIQFKITITINDSMQLTYYYQTN